MYKFTTMAYPKKPVPTERIIECHVDVPLSIHGRMKAHAALANLPLRQWMFEVCLAALSADKTPPRKTSARERTLPLSGVLDIPVTKGENIVLPPVPTEPEQTLDELLESVGMLDPEAPFGGSLP